MPSRLHTDTCLHYCTHTTKEKGRKKEMRPTAPRATTGDSGEDDNEEVSEVREEQAEHSAVIKTEGLTNQTVTDSLIILYNLEEVQRLE